VQRVGIVQWLGGCSLRTVEQYYAQATQYIERTIKGLTPERLILITAVGLVLGTFPIFGLPTLFCMVAALRLKVSFPALQLVNQISSPLQLALLIPLARAGERIFGPHASHPVPLVKLAGLALLDAVGGWFCICVPLGFVLYAALMEAWTHRRVAELTPAG
jgi:hypothetical protein